MTAFLPDEKCCAMRNAASEMKSSIAQHIHTNVIIRPKNTTRRPSTLHLTYINANIQPEDLPNILKNP